MLASDALPWYRYGWPWFLIAVPAVSVALGIMMITLSLRSENSLVVDDYYKAGKAINATLARDAEASRLGLSARITQGAGDTLTLALEGNAGTRWPESLSVRWVHATRASRDGRALLGHVGGGRYASPASALPREGRWRVHVEPDEPSGRWRLVSERLVLGSGSSVVIEASPSAAGRR